MGYLRSLWQYMQTEKGRHDIMDYVRAIIIMAAVMAMFRIMVDVVPALWISVKCVFS